MLNRIKYCEKRYPVIHKVDDREILFQNSFGTFFYNPYFCTPK